MRCPECFRLFLFESVEAVPIATSSAESQGAGDGEPADETPEEVAEEEAIDAG